MFVLSLAYNVIHVLCLFYQVITLNVAVNSYSNSLLTLLISNQFVEIKGAVFKKIEKENLFQLTCADVVERFQLWIILLIIAMRNIVEVGGLSVPGAGSEIDKGSSGPGPLHTNSILPASFAVWPSWLLSGEVLSPFFVVIGIEMMVDWIKHAYINKFNNVKPAIYDRMLDILSQDYYTNVSACGSPTCTARRLLTLSDKGLRNTFSNPSNWPAADSPLVPFYPRLPADLPHAPIDPPPAAHAHFHHGTVRGINIHAVLARHGSSAGAARHDHQERAGALRARRPVGRGAGPDLLGLVGQLHLRRRHRPPHHAPLLLPRLDRAPDRQARPRHDPPAVRA